MFICQLGMHNNVQGHRNAKVCKQTFDGSCSHVLHSIWLHGLVTKVEAFQEGD